jgi:hypothetical protein
MERKLAMSQLGDESVSCNVGTTTSTTPVDFRWNSAGPIEEMHCTQVICNGTCVKHHLLFNKHILF